MKFEKNLIWMLIKKIYIYLMLNNNMRNLFMTLLFVSLVSGLDLSQAKTPKAEIVDANHFFSETSKEKSYNVNKV